MHILLCNERFVFRFGVDRVLIMLGKGLRQLGHEVSVMTMRCDRPVVDAFATKVTLISPEIAPYVNLNESTAQWLEDEWGTLFSQGQPDVVVIGGWPFYNSIEVFRRKGCITIFNDFGAVPLEGFQGGALAIQEKLRDLRRIHLRNAHQIIGISEFILNTQSIPDTDHLVPARSVLLGVDHIESDIWSSDTVEPTGDMAIVSRVHDLRQSGKRIIINLGRWEPGCYKNSEAAFAVTGIIRRSVPDVCLLTLADANELHVPEDLGDAVLPVGFPDDAALRQLMMLADFGISVSKWEGFNLPLGEMQWLRKPVLVFNVGAHPEVVMHPWYLCSDEFEMAQKGVELLTVGDCVGAAAQESAFRAFRDRFSWDRAVQQYQEIFVATIMRSRGGIRLIIDVTNATRDPANSGVIRVTRMISRAMQTFLDPVFVVWDDNREQYVFPNEAEYHQLGEFNGPQRSDTSVASPANDRIPLRVQSESGPSLPTWLFLTETVLEERGRQIRRFAKEHDISIAAVFYDAIPVLHPELCKDAVIRDNHRAYMKGLASVDVVLPISQFSADCLLSLWKDEQLGGCRVAPVLIAGNFSGDRPVGTSPNRESKEIKILCVSTLEPRKNHRNLIEACLAMQHSHPDIGWSLTLVGNRYSGAPEIPAYIEQIMKENLRIRWLGIVEDSTLDALYREATFTVYPSLIEGFGLPIIESIFYGKPCLTHERGVMAELAKDGGCMTTDVSDVSQFADALYRLATDRRLRETLEDQARERRVKTWNGYCTEVLNLLLQQNHEKQSSIEPAAAATDSESVPSWTEILYPSCLCENWQMNDSERLALTSILARHKPQCSIEVGTYHGGSLSLLAQYSKIVFSIDIDPSIRGKYSFISNASFLTGPSQVVLPLLIGELDQQGIPIDFVLIDGDHSGEGVRQDLDIILSYKPRTPLFVLLHDSFNPECRGGMLAARWQESPYVSSVDLDFVPGRMVEHGGGGDGELWGGLAMAYLTPSPRRGPLEIGQSASRMHQVVRTRKAPGKVEFTP